jgi:hypothetical protein
MRRWVAASNIRLDPEDGLALAKEGPPPRMQGILPVEEAAKLAESLRPCLCA